MAASTTTSWLHSSLLSHSSREESAQQALYGTDLPMHPSAHLAQEQQHRDVLDVVPDGRHPCDAFCQPHECALNVDFQPAPDSQQQLSDFTRPAGGSGYVTAGGENGGGYVSARKVHKADREKLRRDRLNEQFTELAGVLDPDRPKNDKATILGDSVQVVKELRSEVKRLRIEQTSLLDESRDLQQEKSELREEKAALKSETEQLQGQLQQRVHMMLPWMGMDPSMMMGAPPYGYPMPVPQPVSTSPASDMNQAGQQSVPQPHSYIPMGQTTTGAYALHPGLQAYAMYANRPGDGGAAYLPYPQYPSPMASHPHVERPYPQYASPMQPLPSYLMQMQPHQGQSPMSGAHRVPSMYPSFASGMPLVPPRSQGTQSNVPARAATVHLNSPCPDGAPRSVARVDNSGSASSVQTTLQLQTPLQPQPQKPPRINSSDALESSTDAQSGATGSGSGVQKESQGRVQHSTSPPTLGNTTNFSLLTTGSGGLCSPGTSSTCNRGELVATANGNKDVAGATQNDPLRSHDPTIRPPVA